MQRAASYYRYELRGVVVHSGSAFAGHYYSYIKVGGWLGGVCGCRSRLLSVTMGRLLTATIASLLICCPNMPPLHLSADSLLIESLLAESLPPNCDWYCRIASLAAAGTALTTPALKHGTPPSWTGTALEAALSQRASLRCPSGFGDSRESCLAGQCWILSWVLCGCIGDSVLSWLFCGCFRDSESDLGRCKERKLQVAPVIYPSVT
jgi:hypothetical protein